MEVDGKAITRENKLQQWARWGTWGAYAWGGICGDGREIAIDPQGTPLPSLHRSVDGINSHTSQWEGAVVWERGAVSELQIYNLSTC